MKSVLFTNGVMMSFEKKRRRKMWRIISKYCKHNKCRVSDILKVNERW